MISKESFFGKWTNKETRKKEKKNIDEGKYRRMLTEIQQDKKKWIQPGRKEQQEKLRRGRRETDGSN